MKTCLVLLVSCLACGCSLVTVPVKTAGSIVTTTVETTGKVITAPFEAVGRSKAASENDDKPAKQKPEDVPPAQNRYFEETRPALPAER